MLRTKDLLLVAAALLAAGCQGQRASDIVAELRANHFSSGRDHNNTCHVGETFCNDACNAVMLCTAGNPVTLTTCSQSEICDAASQSCKPLDVGRCSLPNQNGFRCNSPGAFPNPYDCHKHHYCVEIRAYINISYTCEGDTAYDPLTTMCILTNQDRVCREGPVPTCLTPGQSGPQVENPNIYYICVSEGSFLVPWLFRCPHDTEIFDGTDCVPASTSTPTTPTSTPTTCIYSSTTPTTQTTTPTTATTTATTVTTTPTTSTTTPTTATTTPTTVTTTPTTDTTTASTQTTTTQTTTPTTATTTPTICYN